MTFIPADYGHYLMNHQECDLKMCYDEKERRRLPALGGSNAGMGYWKWWLAGFYQQELAVMYAQIAARHHHASGMVLADRLGACSADLAATTGVMP